MQIGSVSTNSLTPVDTKNMNAIDVSMLKKSLETIEINGSMLTKMMETSVAPHIGSNIDIRV